MKRILKKIILDKYSSRLRNVYMSHKIKKNGINIIIDINFSVVKLFMGDLKGCLINFVCILK